MVEIGAIKAFLFTPQYTKVIETVVERAKKKLCEDLYDAEVVHCQKVLAAASVSLSDLEALLAGDSPRVEEFCVRLVKAEKALNVGQDFNPLEPDEREEENETYVGHSRTFLLTFAVMYLVLRDRRPEFAAYLKTMRQPKAAKYQRGVESVFDSL